MSVKNRSVIKGERVSLVTLIHSGVFLVLLILLVKMLGAGKFENNISNKLTDAEEKLEYHLKERMDNISRIEP